MTSTAGTGAIHISEIAPTLLQLEKDLGINLRDNTLGSVGKKQFSGDIDVAVRIADADIPALVERVRDSSIVEFAQKSILVVISKVKIQNYNPSLETDKERTGFVQCDFMTGENVEWLKTFYHAPSETESKYKGGHRNTTIGCLSQYVDPIPSKELLPDGRPASVERYMYSSKSGLVRIIRTPVPRKDGKGFTRAHHNEVIDGPWLTGDEIAAKLKLGTNKDLNSFETVFAAIERNHSKELVTTVANALTEDKLMQRLGMPTEVEKYL